MSFREKSAWISLVANLAIYGFYFFSLATAFGRGEADGAHFLGPLVRTMILFTAVIIVLNIAIAVSAPKDARTPADERDTLFMLKATHASYFVLATGAVCGGAAALLNVPGFWTANLLFLSLVLAEVFKDATQIFFYRRGA